MVFQKSFEFPKKIIRKYVSSHFTKHGGGGVKGKGKHNSGPSRPQERIQVKRKADTKGKGGGRRRVEWERGNPSGKAISIQIVNESG